MKQTQNKLIAIIGPTASGKTALSIELAKRLNTEIISADSRQIYKLMDIGTAKPSPTEMQGIKHHFIDYINPDQSYSAGLFAEEATTKINELLLNNVQPIIVGGSGLYIQALCEGFFPEEEKDNTALEVRQNLNTRFELEGISGIAEDLKNVDPDSYNKYTDSNPRRLLRALEFYLVYGKRFSDNLKEFLPNLNFAVQYFEIEHSREDLYNRINLRTELMWENGILEETKHLLELGYSTNLNALNTVGYKETISYLNQEISKERVIDLIAQNTRRYAKRQITWFKKYAPSIKLSGNIDEMIKIILSITDRASV